MKPDTGVAVRISALCLAPDGRPVDRRLASDAVRGAPLVDLAPALRMTSDEDGIAVDGTPTGSAANRLLAAITAEAERPLDGWLDGRRIRPGGRRRGGHDLRSPGAPARSARPASASHRPGPEQTGRDLSRSASDWPADASPADASQEDAYVTVVAEASGPLDRGLGAGQLLPPATGDAERLCRTVVGH